MTVTDVQLHWTGQTGTETREKSEYTAVYIVETDDASDGPNIIKSKFATDGSLPYIDDPYTFGNDANPLARCTSLTPTRIEGSHKLWNVALRFETPDVGDPTDEEGNSEENPLLWRDEIFISAAQFDAEVYNDAELIDAPLPHLNMAVDVPVPVVNAAGDRARVRRDDSRHVVRIVKYLRTFNGPQAREYRNTLNSDAIDFTGSFTEYQDVWEPETAKMNNITGEFNIRKGIKYWRVTYEIHIDDDKWVYPHPNLSFHVFDPFALAALENEVSNAVITDGLGNPVSQPQWIDVNGQKTENKLADINFINYRLYQKKNWGVFDLPGTGA